MIITRSPLRISLGGGGTDLPSYYHRRGGFLVAAAVDKYVYITVHRTFVDELIVKYSKMERVRSADQLQHPIIREALGLAGLQGPYLEIASLADIPAGTGLGSSGSFTTALLKALHVLTKRVTGPGELAEEACHIEIDRLGEPVGKQDQYIAAYGGLTCFEFRPDGGVDVSPLEVAPETLYDLEDNLLLFFTGYSRSASSILRDQDDRTRQGETAMLEQLDLVKELGLQSRRALEGGDLRRFAELMHRHWIAKRRRSEGMSNSRIDAWYDQAMANGALGGKLIGAGGGGFLMLYTEDKTRLRRTMTELGLPELRFRFDLEGTRIVVQ